MFCTKCGKQNPDNTKFCIDCGNPLKQPAPISSTSAKVVEEIISPPVKPVTEQQKPNSVFCTKCGKQNSVNTKFCVECGNILAPDSVIQVNEPVIEQRKKEIIQPALTTETKTVTPPVVQNIPVEKPKQETVPLHQEKINTQQQVNVPVKKKKTGLIITIILLIMLIGGGAGYWYYNEQQALKYFTRDYTGYINNSYVTVGVVRQGYIVSGTIKINKGNTAPVFLKGTVDGNGNFSIYSSDMSATFKGQFVGKTIMTGTASSSRDKKTIEFNLVSHSTQ